MISNPSKIDEVRFWGRIRGTKANYYVAISTRFVGEYESPSKAFYYSTEDFKFQRLPFVIWGLKDWISSVEYDNFSGNPKLVLKKLEKKNEASENEEIPENSDPVEPEHDTLERNTGEEEIEIGEKKKNKMNKNKKTITELERLAFVVRAIENECAVVPVGSVKIMPNHQLR